MAETDLNQEVANPFVGPRPFEARHSRFFFGREREARDLLSLVISERLVLFYAQSGAGKSSLINTRLVPGLEREGFFVFPIARVGGALPKGIQAVENIFVFNLLTSLHPDKAAVQQLTDTSLPAYLQAYRATLPPAEEGEASAHVLILDQFEEIVTTHLEAWPKRRPFFLQLKEAMADDPLLWVVLAAREDHVAALEPYARLLPGRLRGRYYMQRLGDQSARDAVEKPAAAGGRRFVDGAAQILVDKLRELPSQDGEKAPLGEFVEPVQLQVVCRQLWEKLAGRPGTEITPSDVEEFGDVNRALAEFYEQAIIDVLKETGGSELALRAWFEEKLITEAQTRGTVYQGKEETAGMDNQTVRLLAQHYLLRAEARAGGDWYELSHDRLVEPILQANQAWRLRQNPLVQAAEEWHRCGREREQLYRGEQLAAALVDLNRQTLEPLVQEFLTASEEAQQLRDTEAMKTRVAEERQRADERATAAKRLRWLAAGLVIALLFAAWVAFIAEGERQVAESLALTSDAQAVTNADLAATSDAQADANQLLAATAAAAQAQAEAAREVAIAAQAEANAERVLAQSRLLVSKAADRLLDNPHAALLLAIEAGRITYTVEVDNVLRQAIQASQQQAVLQGHGASVNAVAFSPTGGLLATAGDDGSIRLWSVPGGEALAVLGGHEDQILALAFSSDGAWLTSASVDGVAFRWQIACLLNALFTDQPACRTPLNEQPDPVSRIAFSADGRQLAITDQLGGLQLWRLDSSEVNPISLQADESIVTTVAFSADGRWLATASDNQMVRLWEIGPSQALSSTLSLAENAIIQDVLFDPAANRLAVGTDLGIQLWNADNLLIAPVELKRSQLQADSRLAFSQDGRWLAATEYSTVLLWNVANPQADPFTLQGHSDTIVDLAFDPTGRWLATASWDWTVRLWDLDHLWAGSVAVPVTLAGHFNSLRKLAFSPNGRWLATAGIDGTTILWTTSEPQPVLRLAADPPYAFLAGGPRFLTGTFTTTQENLLAVNSFATNLSNLGQSGALHLWEVTTARDTGFSRAALRVTLEEEPVFGLAFSPERGLLATSAISFTESAVPSQSLFRLWEMPTTPGPLGEQLLITVPNQTGAIFQVAFNGDGSLLATSHISFTAEGEAQQSSLHLWDVSALLNSGEGQALSAVLPVPVGVPFDFAFSPGDALLATSTISLTGETASRGSIYLWDISAVAEGGPATVAATLTDQGRLGATGIVYNPVAFSPDGRLMATTDRSGAVRLWQVSSVLAVGATPLSAWALLEGHQAAVMDLAFSPDGRWLAASSEDGTIRLWPVSRNDVEARILPGHTGAVSSVAFSPDGRWLVSRGTDRTVRLWLIDGEALLVSACDQAARNLTQLEWATSFAPDQTYELTCPHRPPHASMIQALIEVDNERVQYDKAAALLDQADPGLALNPAAEIARALLQLGQQYVLQEQLSRAEVAFRQAVDLDPRLQLNPDIIIAAALLEQARRQVDNGQLPEGQVTLERAMTLDPTLASGQTTDLAEIYQTGCRQALTESREALIESFCSRSAELAMATGNLDLMQAACASGAISGEADLFGPLCERLAALASEQEDFELNYQICLDGSYTGERVALACERAADLVLASGDVYQNNDVCSSAAQPSLNALFAPACERAAELAAEVIDPYLYFEICLDGNRAGVAAVVAPLCEQVVELAEASEQPELYSQICRDGSAAGLMTVAAPACERAVALALELGDIYYNLDLCYQSSTPALADIVQPACSQAVALALESEDAYTSSELCGLSEIPSLAATVAPACQQAVTLAREFGDVYLNNNLCRLGRIAGLASMMTPACQSAVELAAAGGDAFLNTDLCQYATMAGLAVIATPACERAVELAAEIGDPYLNYVLCLHRTIDELAAVVAPACELTTAANPITPDTSVSGFVESGTSYFWTFTGTAGQIVTIQMNKDNNNSLDSYLVLLGPNGAYLMYNDDSGSNLNALIADFVLPETGLYTIVARGYGVSSVGAYLLSLALTEAP